MTKKRYIMCLVPTCKKRKADFPDKLFYVLPRHKSKRDIRHEWVKACKVDLSKISDDSKHFVICDDHFAPTDFERDLQGELLGLNRQKKLKADAVPWIDLPPENYQADKPGENEVEQNHQEIENVKTEDDSVTDTKIDKQQQKKKKGGRRKKRRRPPPRPPQYGCLICCKKIQGSAAAKSTNYFGKFTCPGARDYDNQEEGSAILNKQLWHIFILRNVLKIESSKCVELLEQFGKERDPDNWFYLCVKCGGDVARALELHEQILRLEEEIREIFNRICETAKKTVEMDKDKDSSLKKNEVENMLWSLIREVNGILTAEMEIKDEPLDLGVDEDDSFNGPNSPVNCPTNEKEEMNSQSRSQMDLASRIDKLLAENEAIVGEPLSRPSGFSSDSDSDLDGNLPKIKKVAKAKVKLIKPKPPPPPEQSQKPSSKQPLAPKPTLPPHIPIRYRKQLLIARKDVDSNYKKLNCPYNCPAVFSTKDLLARHIQAHKTSKESGDKYKCKFCGFVVLNDDLLKQHLEIRHHNQTQPNIIDINFVDCPCPYCEVRFHNYNILKYEAHVKLHEKNANNKELNCPHDRCGYPAEDSNSLVRHLQNMHGERLMNTCETCGFTVSKTLEGKWRSHLVMHKLNEYVTRGDGEGEEPTKTFGCPICPAENFETLKRLIYHKRVHHAIELGCDIFLCSDCPRTFFKKSSLHSHVKANHETDKDTDRYCEIICETCGESCSSQFNLKIHQKKHNRPVRQVKVREKRKYICGRCGVQLSDMARLRRHEKKCGEEAQESKKKAHKQLPKEMECIHCKIKLPHRAAMRRHVKIHAQHKCNLCGNLFLSRDNLMKHKRVVHRAGPQTVIKCQYCGKEFKHRINLYSHYSFCQGMGVKRDCRERRGGGNACRPSTHARKRRQDWTCQEKKWKRRRRRRIIFSRLFFTTLFCEPRCEDKHFAVGNKLVFLVN